MRRVSKIRQPLVLSLEKCAARASSLANFEDDEWDKQMKRDAAAGKFAEMNRQAEAAFKLGKTKSLATLLNKQ